MTVLLICYGLIAINLGPIPVNFMLKMCKVRFRAPHVRSDEIRPNEKPTNAMRINCTVNRLLVRVLPSSYFSIFYHLV